VTLGAAGVLSCLDAADGNVAWRNSRFTGVPRFFTAMSPIIVDGMAVAHLGGADDGAVVAFDLGTGKEKWKWTGAGPAYASPVLMTAGGTRQLVVQTDRSLVGLAVADGKLLWQVATPTQRRFYNCATPIIDRQTVIYTGQGRGTKAVRIEKQGGGFAAKPLWSNPDLGTGFNTPVLGDCLLFGMSARGNFFCLDAETGKTAWTDSNRVDRFCAILAAGPVLLALPTSGELIAFKPSGKACEEVARVKVSDTETFAHPVIAGKRVFIKSQDDVALLTF
jgi:outer membrane protein assembly factor BamB